VKRALLGAALALALLPAVAGADATSARVRHVRVGDVDLAYRSIGHGRPVLMIMGLGGTMDAWLPQLVDRIGRGRRVVVFDNRGTGRSTAGIKPITVRTMAGDTHGLIRTLRLKHPNVLGWSMGGFIAQRLDLDHPADVDHLVLAATTGGGPGSSLPDPAALSTLLTGGPAALLGLLFPLPAQQATADAYVASITRWPAFSLTVPPETLAAQLSTSSQWFAHGANLKRIKVPTLVGGGLEDQLIPPANQRRLAAGIKGARLVLYPGAAHGFLAQDWRSFGARVDRFFADARLAARQ
jgi:pimeloyl-ACP methyl ester carboxylesterase